MNAIIYELTIIERVRSREKCEDNIVDWFEDRGNEE